MVRRACGTRVMHFKACLDSFASTCPENRPAGQLHLSLLSTAFPGPTARSSLLVALEGSGFQTRLAALVPQLQARLSENECGAVWVEGTRVREAVREAGVRAWR